MIGSPEYLVTARLEPDGTVKVKVTAFCSYGTTGRKAAIDVEITDEELLKKYSALGDKAAKSVSAELGVKATVAAAEAIAHAAKRQEVI